MKKGGRPRKERGTVHPRTMKNLVCRLGKLRRVPEIGSVKKNEGSTKGIAKSPRLYFDQTGLVKMEALESKGKNETGGWKKNRVGPFS